MSDSENILERWHDTPESECGCGEPSCLACEAADHAAHDQGDDTDPEIACTCA